MLEILSIKLSGFKNYEEETYFDFKKTNYLKGRSGSGKSSIGEAIVYALYGANLQGNEKADLLMRNNQSKQMLVELVFTLNGEKHILCRRRRAYTEVTLNGFTIPQAELSNMLPPKDLFLAIFAPEYFLSMGGTDARNFLIKYLPQIEKSQVLEKLDDFYAKYLENRTFGNPNILLKELREDLREGEKDLAFSEGSLATKKGEQRDFVMPEAVAFDEAPLNEALEKIKALREKKKPDLLDVGFLKEQKKEIEGQITALTIAPFEGELKDTASLENEKNKLSGMYLALKNQKEQLLINEDVCPTCLQEVNKEHLENSRNKLDEEIGKIIKEGNNLSEKIKEAETYNEELKVQFEKERVGFISILKEEIANLKIEEFELENEKLIKEFEDLSAGEVAYWEEKILDLQKEKSVADMANVRYQMAIEAKAKLEKDIESFEKDLERVNKKIVDINMTIEAIGKYNASFVELQAEFLSQYLNKVSLNLQKFVKSTGELKDTFEVLYDGREFKMLSKGEKTYVFLELSELFMKLGNLKLPIFVDNAEGATDMILPDTQIFQAETIKGKDFSLEAI